MMKEIKINCLGYNTTFMKTKMWYYKMEMDGSEYLIVDAGMIKLLQMVWTKENKFENADFSKKIESLIQEEIKSVKKVNKELGKDGEKKFFTQHEIKALVEKKKPFRKELIFDEDEVNSILSVFDEFDFTYGRESKGKKISQDMIDYVKENYDEYFSEAFERLKGYKVSFETDGSHKNDGQMVEYAFLFKSPSGKETYLTTEMCLMVGWNYHESLKIK
ncbi:MAG: hypothetical protein AABY15_01545 [Nanoarchaeota archaeon]